LVFFDRITDEFDTHTVIIDNFKAAYKATSHLIDEGHRRIACLVSAKKLSITRERIAGYEKALSDSNIQVDIDLIKSCEHSGLDTSEVDVAVNYLLNHNPRPDAILGLSDKLTIGCLRILQSRNIKIPEEIALVGFSNSDLSELLHPSLTVIRQPAFEMGEIAISLLLKEIESKRPLQEYDKKMLEAELVIRESSRKLSRS
jgi:LacI family transcriptional regulator